jgi:RNA 3'-terminal phosphate cyclase (ATP)
VQVALPCAVFAPGGVALRLRGGTNADMAPQIDEFTEIFLPNVAKFGFKFEFEVARKGFFPKGGGEVNFFLSPVERLVAVDLTEVGRVTEVRGWAFTAGSLPAKVAERMAAACRETLAKAGCSALEGVEPAIEAYKEDAKAACGTGSGMVLVAR